MANTLEQVFREEYGRIIATLIRISGSFDLAEEALQEAFIAAVSKWEREGPPNNPGAWLTTVAHRKLLDALRRERTRTDKESELTYEASRLRQFVEPELFEDNVEYSDDRLRLIFTCCHPSLTREAQVALTLRTLGGLTTTEIAHAFLVPETTLAQRLVRAKQKIRLAGIPYEIPSLERIADRLAAVEAVIYLIFNEGYAASTGQNLIRNDLCAEAIRLGRVLCELLPDEPENLGLLALMLLQNSRREARVNKQGELVTLEEQDRSLWNASEIDEGVNLIQKALRLHRVGNYQLQAAIAAIHAEAKSADKTDWRQIVALYEELMRLTSSPIVALNHAAAVAMSEGFEKGLALIESIGADSALQNYYLFHASRADLLRRLHRHDEALVAYATALSLTTNEVEQNYIRRRIEEIQPQ
ncbi:MAG TPA: RNA polymerase sigma factor [Pyrinomonadaceae bacterium]|nr:RNA polymerase sigma factor [Pyrinomonadaceae bacterium]